MRDPERIPVILKRLERVWRKNPDWRLGQLMVNAGFDDLFFPEDDVLIEGLEAEVGIDPTSGA